MLRYSVLQIITLAVFGTAILSLCLASDNVEQRFYHSDIIKRERPFDFEYFVNGNIFEQLNGTAEYAEFSKHSGVSLGFAFYNEWHNIVQSMKVTGEKASPQCFQQLGALVAGFGTGDLASYKYFDSWGKIPAGIVKGHFVEMGNFDECVDLKKALMPDTDPMVGKYCFANFPLGKLLPPTPLSSLFSLSIGVCMPAACSAQEFDVFFKLLLKNLLNLNFNDGTELVGEYSCSVRAKPPLTGWDWYTIVLLILLGSAMLFSSLYDYQCRANKKTPNPLFVSYSIPTNLTALLSVKPNVKNPNVITCLNGIRCMSLIWVIYGHTFECLLGSPVINTADILAWGRTAFGILLQKGIFAVDSFFFLSGLLLSFIGLRDIEKNKGKLNVPMMYLHRILRLTPMVAMAVLFAATLCQYLTTSPNWPTVQVLATACQEKWWSTLLYVQNYVNPELMCFPHTWYLAVDTQLYIISPIFLYALYKWNRKGAAAVAIVALLLVACLFSIIMVREYSYHKNGFYIADPLALQKTYYATHTRASPWFVGLLFGYFMHCTKNRRVVLPKLAVLVGWLVSFGLLLTVLFAFYGKAHNALSISTIEEAFYWSLSRVAWPLALCWIVFACVNGYGGPIDGFLSCPLWQPLARLSFSMYLWHMICVIFDAFRIKTNLYFSNYDVMLGFWSNFGWSLLLSTVMYLAVETPLVQVERILLRNPNKSATAKQQSDK